MPTSERSRGGQAELDGFDGLGLKTISSGWFPGFGHKTGGGLGTVKVCFEAKGSRRGAMPVQCVYENLDGFAPLWASSVISSVGVIW